MRYILTSEEWGAAEEYRLGLVQELTPPGRQLDRALEFADRIATNAPLSVRAALASARQVISGEDPALVALLPAFVQILQSEDAKEPRRGAGTPPPRIPGR
jgi:enoyl-CoA hydratase/carnithine racemase